MEILVLSYSVNTLYLLLSGALVMWMAAGFSMLEAGLVRAKNTAEILTKNIALFGISCLMYLFFGYALMYPESGNGVLPSFGALIGSEHELTALSSEQAPDYALMADFFFQVVFVATAMSIVSGAVAERMKLWAFLAFSVVMTGFIYPIQGYWKWGGGFLDELGFADFAGSGVVHLCGAAAALAAVIVLGPRRGKYRKDGSIAPIPGCNLPLATLGTFILWMGWFGFNGGSQLKITTLEDANAVALVFVNTNMSAAAGTVSALVLARWIYGKADLTMALNGALAGLVAITAEPSAPSPVFASLIGAVAGVLVVISITSIDKLRLDDPVGALSVHGVVGIFGLMVVPLTLEGASFMAQLTGVVAIFSWSFLASLAVWFGLNKLVGVRVSEEEEYDGVDRSECGLEAYPEFMGGK